MNIYSQIESNKTKTFLLMVGFVAFFALVAWLMGEVWGDGSGAFYAIAAMLLTFIMSLGSYFFGDKLVIAMSGARQADRKKDFNLFTVTENLAIAAGIPKPKLYVIDDTAMNAFATGRDPQHAVVVATRGIIDQLDRRELEGVIAHELSHIKNYDIRLMLIVTVLVGTLVYLTDWFLRSLWWGGRSRDERGNRGGGIIIFLGIIMAVLAPFLATIIKLAISRQREYLADASGAMLTRYPDGLANALKKLAGDREVLEAANDATAHLYITNPFKGKDFGSWFAGLFNTHPPIEERIKRLRSM